MEHSFRYDYVELPPSAQIGLHSHGDWELSYVVAGSGRKRLGESYTDFGPGDLVAVAPGVVHCWEFDPASADESGNIVNITVIFSRGFVERMAAFPELADGARRFLSAESAIAFDDATAAEIARQLVGMRGATPGGRLAAMAAVFEIIAVGSTMSVGRRSVSADDVMQRLRVYLECNYMRAVSLREVSDYFGRGKTTFCSMLRRRYNTTFSAVLNSVRISHARRLLADTSQSVAQIAYAVGYTDAAYFNRVFRRLTGMSPTAFRRSGS